MQKDVFIFVPAYNVESTLVGVLNGISAGIRVRSTVLVIDDGSTDGTREIAGKYAENVTVNRAENEIENCADFEWATFEKNRGYGAVVKYGIARGLASGAKFIACLHGDGQYPAPMLGRFVAELERSARGEDSRGLKSRGLKSRGLESRGEKSRGVESRGLALIQGSRRAVEGEARKGGMPLYKRVGGTFLTSLENLTFKNKLTDRHSGFIVYNSEYLKTVNLEKLSGSFDIDLELISIADAEGWSMKEIPIPTRYGDEKSNLNVVTYGIRVLRQIVRRLFR